MIKDLINKQVGEREKAITEIQKRLLDNGYSSDNIEARFNNSEFEHCQTLRLDTGSFFDKNTFVSNMDIETAAELVYFIEHAMNK
jgi:hypothetical protein